MTKRSSRAACAERAFGVEEVEVFFFFSLEEVENLTTLQLDTKASNNSQLFSFSLFLSFSV